MLLLNSMWYRKFSLLLVVLTAAGTTALADVPTPPANVYHAAWSSDMYGMRSIDIYWFRNPADPENVDGYNLYQSVDGGTFTKVDPSFVGGDAWSGYAHIPVTGTGSYTYYATSYNADGESAPGPEASVDMTGNWVWFTAAGEYGQAVAGEEYTRTFAAAAGNGGVVRFSVLPGNDGWGGEIPAEIDPVTGVFRTTIGQDGHYSFPVTVALESDPTVAATLWFYLQVGEDGWGEEPDVCAFISGTVTDTAGNSVSAGYVTAIPRGDFGYMYYTGTIENGRYEIPVPAGEFAVVYEDESYYQYQFYPNELDFIDATPVTVLCNDTATADFTVEAWKDTSAYITVSGRVARTSDGSGVEAEVVFYTVDSWGYDCLWATTDENGYYEAELPVLMGPWQFSYIAMAIPYESDVYSEYYDGAGGTLNPGEAVIIDENRTDVDFTLSAMPEFTNLIEGFITDSDGMPADATIFVFPSTYQGDINTPYYTMTRTMFGEYALHNPAPGSYILVAVPTDSRLAPGYYAGAGSATAMNWEDAEIITIDSTSTSLYADMVLSAVEASGISVVDGTTSQHNGLDSRPLGGTLVYVLNEKNKVVGYAVSDRDGKYRIARLGTGAYRLYADKVGFLSGQATVAFDKPGARHSVDLALSAMATTSVGEAVLGSARPATWPNPAQSHITVRFAATGGEVRLALTDITGRELVVRTVEAVAGENTAQLGVGALPAGMYMLSLKAGSVAQTVPVTIAR